MYKQTRARNANQKCFGTLITNLVNLNEDELSETLLCLESVEIKYICKTFVVTELHEHV